MAEFESDSTHRFTLLPLFSVYIVAHSNECIDAQALSIKSDPSSS